MPESNSRTLQGILVILLGYIIANLLIPSAFTLLPENWVRVLFWVGVGLSVFVVAVLLILRFARGLYLRFYYHTWVRVLTGTGQPSTTKRTAGNTFGKRILALSLRLQRARGSADQEKDDARMIVDSADWNAGVETAAGERW